MIITLSLKKTPINASNPHSTAMRPRLEQAAVQRGKREVGALKKHLSQPLAGGSIEGLVALLLWPVYI